MDLNEFLKEYARHQLPKAKQGLTMATETARHAARQLSEDASQGLNIANDPRNAWIGTNPVGRVGAEGLSLASGLLGMLAGPKSQTANHALLALAKDLQKSGEKPESIWRQTGWFQAPDGGWRYEISDHTAALSSNIPHNKFSPDSLSFPMFEGHYNVEGIKDRTLGLTLDHQALYDAYPQLKNVPVQGTGLNFAMDGAFDPSTGKMYLAGGKHDKVRSTALHEAQHAVQNIEGHTQGGAMDLFLPKDFSKLQDQATAKFRTVSDQIKKDLPDFNYFTVMHALQKQSTGGKLSQYEQGTLASLQAHPMANDFYDALNNKMQYEALSAEAYQKYKLLAGEAEARLTQRRADLTPEQRAQTFPVEQYDVPPSSQIIKEKLGERP
jgi:hypothetical protein